MAAVDLIHLADRRRARVVEIQGNPGMARRLDALGIAPGMVLVKRSSFFGVGPVVLETGMTRIAIGRGMAARVIVEPLEL